MTKHNHVGGWARCPYMCPASVASREEVRDKIELYSSGKISFEEVLGYSKGTVLRFNDQDKYDELLSEGAEQDFAWSMNQL